MAYQPITTEGMASRIRGTVTTQGVSCRWWRVWSSMRSLPWKTRKYMRKL